MVPDDVEIRAVDAEPTRVHLGARERRQHLLAQPRRHAERERADARQDEDAHGRPAPRDERPQRHRDDGDPRAARRREHDGEREQRHRAEAHPALARDEREAERDDEHVREREVVPEEADRGVAVRALDARMDRAPSPEQLAVPVDARVVLDDPVDRDHARRHDEPAHEALRRRAVLEPPVDREVRDDHPRAAQPGASNPPTSVDSRARRAARAAPRRAASAGRSTCPIHVATSASPPSATIPICIPLVESGIDQAVSARQAVAAHRSHATSTATAATRLAA
jgi:hypothetical protein